MTNHRTMLRNALLAVPVVVGLGWFFGDSWEAFGALLSGLTTVVNFWVIMMLTFRLTSSLEDDGRQVALVGVIGLLKVPLAMAVYTAIASYFGLLGAFLGITVLFAPVSLGGLRYLWQTPVPSDDMELGSSS